MDACLKSLSVLSWNVRGLGDRGKCTDVRLALPSPAPSILCLQETKLEDINQFKVASFLPFPRAASYTFKPSLGASGGLLTAWDANLLRHTSSVNHQFTITSTFHVAATDLQFTITNCYGPCSHADKPTFLDELMMLSSMISGPWLLLGEFNLVRLPFEKSSANFDAVEAAWFDSTINSMALQELPLLDRWFTWSNHQEHPILAKLDRFMVSTEWSAVFPNSMVTSASAPVSDH